MSAIGNIKTAYERVKSCLELFPPLQDNDSLLIVKFWGTEIKKMGRSPQMMTAHELLELIGLGMLTSGDTITRARRKVQEECPELRGTKYGKRQEEEKDVRENINQGGGKLI